MSLYLKGLLKSFLNLMFERSRGDALLLLGLKGVIV